jgi:hypothetical protein
MVLNWGFLGSGKIARDFACSMLAVEGSEIVSVVRRRAATLLPLPFTQQPVPSALAGWLPSTLPSSQRAIHAAGHTAAWPAQYSCRALPPLAAD